MLLVSPHFDDAALSAAAFVELPRPIDVVTVFTGAASGGTPSAWDRACGFASHAEALEARGAEDRAAFAAAPHRLLRVGLVEVAYLPGGTRPARDAARLLGWFEDWAADRSDGAAPLVLLPVGAGRRPVPAQRRGLRQLLRLLRWLGRSVALLPAATGPEQHPDHLWVRDTLARHAMSRGAAVAFYEESPYLRGARGDAAAAEVGAALGRRLARVELAVDATAKACRTAAYASQLEQLREGDPALGHEAPAATERYWLVVPERDDLAGDSQPLRET